MIEPGGPTGTPIAVPSCRQTADIVRELQSHGEQNLSSFVGNPVGKFGVDTAENEQICRISEKNHRHRGGRGDGPRGPRGEARGGDRTAGAALRVPLAARAPRRRGRDARGHPRGDRRAGPRGRRAARQGGRGRKDGDALLALGVGRRGPPKE